MNQASLAALARPPVQLPNAPQLLAIASGKGGVGKTWLAITLSHALARAGQRVLLFDGDLGLANVDVQLGLSAERDVSGVLAGTYSLAGASPPSCSSWRRATTESCSTWAPASSARCARSPVSPAPAWSSPTTSRRR
jgi:MinD superfamily P-loop ATPase